MDRDHIDRPRLSVNETLEALYKDNSLESNDIVNDGWTLDNLDELERFYESAMYQGQDVNFRLDLDKDDLDKDSVISNRTTQWLLPKEYMDFDIENFLLSKCNTPEEYQRVQYEIEQFRKHSIMEILHISKFLVDKMRENNVIWGVGRGSSVSSFCLYLIGIHRINPMEFNLDVKEFLK